ncbi:hypothetical protein DFQ28_006026 [Apophysomyces sp. BC1034]|nr:hypothetical protein DFQ30_008317 [Apophysomyces sp. BC1015]KAG0181790.1 hypothetical protein DFQ29_007017 [Apophysomyces sp. BC1021]KAG0193244.1 hypothetical protein DFQ28_006026 [Apophysomyces sp. BC1034]
MHTDPAPHNISYRSEFLAEDDGTATVHSENDIANEATLHDNGNNTKLHQMLLARLSAASNYRLSTLEKEDTETQSTNDQITIVNDDEEDPYRWFILFGGFLAQAISMSTLSSWGESFSF